MTGFLKDLRPVIVPGLRNSGDGHWQTLWQQQLAAQRVEQRNWNVAELAPWTQRVIETVQADQRPSLLIAHSFGCLAVVQALAQGTLDKVAAVLLVAPASPAKFKLQYGMPRQSLNCPAILVGSESDPWLGIDEARQWARVWDSRFVSLGDAGHVNTASGYGPWPEGLDLLEELARRAQRRDYRPRRRQQANRLSFPRRAALAQMPADVRALRFLY